MALTIVATSIRNPARGSSGMRCVLTKVEGDNGCEVLYGRGPPLSAVLLSRLHAQTHCAAHS